MNVMLIGKAGVDLYETLLVSETSRAALKFYRPYRLEFGILLRTASLGSALSLISELRWYITRYVASVLFEVFPDVYCTRALAHEFYERDVPFTPRWRHQFVYLITEGGELEKCHATGRGSAGSAAVSEPGRIRLLVWCTEAEYLAEPPEMADAIENSEEK